MLTIKSRVIAWLRGDPTSIAVVKDHKELLEAQGVILLTPSITSELRVDVIVEPLKGEPEWLLYKSHSRIRAKYIIGANVENPYKALALSLIAPKPRYSMAAIGIDPGTSACGFSLIADDILLMAKKISCSKTLQMLDWIREWLPTNSIKIFLGKGPGLNYLRELLEASRIDYQIVDEDYTTSRPTYWHISRILRDKDLTASVTIALKGVLDIVWPKSLRRRV